MSRRNPLEKKKQIVIVFQSMHRIQEGNEWGWQVVVEDEDGEFSFRTERGFATSHDAHTSATNAGYSWIKIHEGEIRLDTPEMLDLFDKHPELRL